VQPAAIPPNESERLATLRALEILDTAPEPEFDELVQLAAALCGTPIGTVSLIDENRQWLKAAVGLPRNECRRSAAFCAHAILGESVFTVDDATADSRFADNPLVLNQPNIRFYAGIPVATSNNLPLGTLCVIDTVPRHLTSEQKQALEILGRQVNVRFELRAQRMALQQVRAENQELRGKLQETLRQLEEANQRMEALASSESSPSKPLRRIT
jgi:adenylate cyclase